MYIVSIPSGQWSHVNFSGTKLQCYSFLCTKKSQSQILWKTSTKKAGLDVVITFVILLRRVVSMGLFLEMGTVFHPSSWGWLVLPPPGPRPPMLPPILLPESLLDRSCCWTLICSLCSSIFASLWIWSIVLGPWSPLRGTQLFWKWQKDDYMLIIHYWWIIQRTSMQTRNPKGWITVKFF